VSTLSVSYSLRYVHILLVNTKVKFAVKCYYVKINGAVELMANNSKPLWKVCANGVLYRHGRNKAIA